MREADVPEPVLASGGTETAERPEAPGRLMLSAATRATIAAKLQATADWRGVAVQHDCSLATIYRIAEAAGIPVPRGTGQVQGRLGNRGKWDHEGTVFVLPRPEHPLARLVVVESADAPVPRPFQGRSLIYLGDDEPAGRR